MPKAWRRWAALAAAGTAAACAGDGAQQFLSLGTAGTGGIYYPLGGALASQLSLADSIRQYTAEVSGGSIENINRLAVRQMDLAMVLAVSAYQAYRGEGDFSEPVADLRILAPLYPNLSHVMVPRSSDAADIGDLVGLRVSVGPPGSGTEQIARHLLEAHGLTYDDIDVRYLSFTESASALRDGAIDAAIISVGYPASSVLEATTTGGVRLLGVLPETVAALRETHPYYTAGEIPAGAYPRVQDPIPTMAVLNWIVGLESLDGEVVEILLNIMTEGRVNLEQVHDMARQIDMARLEDPPIPLHPTTRGWVDGRSQADNR